MELDLAWDMALQHRTGAEARLCGIDVFHEFAWLDVFSDQRTQFRNGKRLAEFVIERCPESKTPALLLTIREDVPQGLRQTDNFAVFIVNIDEYVETASDAALSYLASHLDVDIADVEQLSSLAEAAEPAVLRQFFDAHLEIDHIVNWLGGQQGRLEQLGDAMGTGDRRPLTLAEALNALRAVDGLSAEDIDVLAQVFAETSDREQRIELLRAVTNDASGRYVTGEVFAERRPQRVADARTAVDGYRALLETDGTNETAMQTYIEAHPWLLGLDYAGVRARGSGPSGATDFWLERYDGFSDLLELKSPADPIVRAPDVTGTGSPSPHEFALSAVLAQALAQAIAYRDRLTRFPEVAEELHGIRNSREPRLIIVVGQISELPDHRRRILVELNKSLHRVEIVPYDVLALRAESMLDNVEHYFEGN